MCLTKVNVLTCDYIDFCLAHVTTLTVIYKMYKKCAITFTLHDKLFHRVATIVVFNNALYCMETYRKKQKKVCYDFMRYRDSCSKNNSLNDSKAGTLPSGTLLFSTLDR